MGFWRMAAAAAMGFWLPLVLLVTCTVLGAMLFGWRRRR
jgi:Na+-transporting NADH:ubiquinone oxidoreductase subunit NqrE